MNARRTLTMLIKQRKKEIAVFFECLVSYFDRATLIYYFLRWLQKERWKVMIMDYNIPYGGYSIEKKAVFLKFQLSWVTDTKNLCKYHLMAYKKSIIDQNLKGIAHLKRLPRPWEV